MTLYERSVTLAHRAYKLTLSPLIGRQCRFLPTCSDYAREALITHGPLRGGWLATKRLCSCHPWGRSGYDPVPAPPRKKKTMSENLSHYEFDRGAVRVWLDGGIHIKAVTDDEHRDPVELSEDEALELAQALQALVAQSRKGL